MDINLDVFRPHPALFHVLNVGVQGGRDSALAFDEVKLERLRDPLNRAQRCLKRDNRRAVFALFVAPRPGKSVDVDNPVEALAVADNREPCPQIRAENFEFSRRMGR